MDVGHRAIRSHDTSVPFVFGGITGTGGEFLERLCVDHDAHRYLSVVNYHSYLETWNPESLEHLPRHLDWILGIIKDHGSGEKLWMLEVGYSTYRDNGFVSDVYQTRWDHEHTPGYQAEHMSRTLVLAAGSGPVEKLAWYRLNDLPVEEAVIGDRNNRYLGLRDGDGRPKPSLKWLNYWNTRFLRARSAERIFDISRSSEPLTARVLRTGRSDTPLVLVAWIPNRTDPSSGEESVRRDTRFVTLTLKLPDGVTFIEGDLSIMGKNEPLEDFQRSGNRISVSLRSARQTAWLYFGEE